MAHESMIARQCELARNAWIDDCDAMRTYRKLDQETVPESFSKEVIVHSIYYIIIIVNMLPIKVERLFPTSWRELEDREIVSQVLLDHMMMSPGEKGLRLNHDKRIAICD